MAGTIVHKPHIRAVTYVRARRAIRWMLYHGYDTVDETCPEWVRDAMRNLRRAKRNARLRREREAAQ